MKDHSTKQSAVVVLYSLYVSLMGKTLDHYLSFSSDYSNRLWVCSSSAVIAFNKSILSQYPFPLILTTWHVLFSTIATQLLAQTTALIDGRKFSILTRRIYFSSILPIGLSFSLNLIFNNAAYIYLNVAFIQMFKVSLHQALYHLRWNSCQEMVGDRSCYYTIYWVALWAL